MPEPMKTPGTSVSPLCPVSRRAEETSSNTLTSAPELFEFAPVTTVNLGLRASILVTAWRLARSRIDTWTRTRPAHPGPSASKRVSWFAVFARFNLSLQGRSIRTGKCHDFVRDCPPAGRETGYLAGRAKAAPENTSATQAPGAVIRFCPHAIEPPNPGPRDSDTGFEDRRTIGESAESELASQHLITYRGPYTK